MHHSRLTLPGGCSTSVGRKPTGQFSQLFDKDFNRIGLRKP